MQQLVDLLLGALQNRPINNAPATQNVTFKDFENEGPPEFKGTSEPIEAQGWVKEIEKTFIIVGVREE